MVVIVGQRLYGKSDQVRGVFYVATRFVHLYWVPLIPLKSYLVLEGNEGASGFRGFEIPLSLKSVLLGWLRGALMVAGLAFLAMGMYSLYLILTDGLTEIRSLATVAAPWGKSTVFLGAYALSRWLSRASLHKALRLASQAGLPADVITSRYPEAALIPMQNSLASG